MEIEDWKSSWEEGNSPWHSEKSDKLLKIHFDQLNLPNPGADCSVLVPLAGNSAAPKFFHDRGYSVVVVEVSQIAIDDMLSRDFSGNSVVPQLSLHVGDFFEYNPEEKFNIIYDRAALVAIHPERCVEYTQKLRSLLAPDGAIVLETLTYQSPELIGPPFSVSDDDLERYFEGMKIEVIDRREFEPESRRLAEAGVKTASCTLLGISVVPTT